MNSHKYAEELRGLAEFLLSKPAFETDEPRLHIYYWSDKQQLLSAVKAVGSGRKEYDRYGDFIFHVSTPPGVAALDFRASRSAVCRKVQEERWECEPLLSPDEERELTSSDY